MERIIAAVDGSESSLKAVGFAARMAKSRGSELILLTVVPRAAIASDNVDLQAYAKSEGVELNASEIARSDARDVLEQARQWALAQGQTKVSTETTLGDPAAEIIAFAKGCHADAIVVGSRGHGRLVGLVLGSVAQKIVSYAHCPVTVVR